MRKERSAKEMKDILEGKALIRANQPNKISRDMPVFFNPVMSLNRDIAVSVIRTMDRPLRIADILAGTGIRAIRFLKESKKKIELTVNDGNPKAIAEIKKNLALNKIPLKKVSIMKTDGSDCLIHSGGFDYIEIDPFGSPNPFLDASCKHLARGGILAVTATDTAALAGTAPASCQRKYWAIPLKNHFMHETGLRILARKIQLIGIQYDKALVPVFSHHTEHYARIYLKCEKSKKAVKSIVKQHSSIGYCRKCFETAINPEKFCRFCRNELQIAGPLWTGQLWDKAFSREMIFNAPSEESRKLIQQCSNEASISSLGFFSIHKICKEFKLAPPTTEKVLSELRKKKFSATTTHFGMAGIRTTAPAKEVIRILKSLH